MKIWFINHYAIPPSQPGGTRHYTLARELIGQGHEVTIFASSVNYLSRQETQLRSGEVWKKAVCAGVPFVWLRTPPYSKSKIARMWNMIHFSGRVWLGTGTQQLEKPDVILGSTPHLFAALAAERLARRHGVPFVLEVRDLWPQTLIDLGKMSPRHPLVLLMGWIERFLYRRAERIISVLPGAVEHIVQKGAASGKVVWIPNGVDLDNVPAPVPPAEDGTFTLMYVGAHGLANGLDNILDTATILEQDGRQDRLRFRLVGDGPEKPRLQARVETEGLHTVCFQQPVPKEQIYSILQNADAFIMLLKDAPVFRWGISSNKLFDYLALARPIVFSVNAPSNPVAEARAGFSVPAEDAPAMAEAIRQLMAMPPTARWEMGLRGRRYVAEHHAMARLSARLDSVLGDVVKEKASDNGHNVAGMPDKL